MRNNTMNQCPRCNDGYPLPEKEAARTLDRLNEMYLSIDDGKIWLTSVPDDPFCEVRILVRFCPWCGRELHVMEDVKD